jgi:hypothetical protein
MSSQVVLAILVFAVGLWIGVGAPGWPNKGEGGRRHTQKRSINPIAWGRTPGRERQRPRAPGDRKIRLRQ